METCWTRQEIPFSKAQLKYLSDLRSIANNGGDADCILDRIRLAVPQPTEWQCIANQIDAAFIFARSDFVNVHWNYWQPSQASPFNASMPSRVMIGTMRIAAIEYLPTTIQRAR